MSNVSMGSGTDRAVESKLIPLFSMSRAVTANPPVELAGYSVTALAEQASRRSPQLNGKVVSRHGRSEPIGRIETE